MEHYVTLFDLGFAPQGLALHLSLQRHAGEHTLWVICMDEGVKDLLEKLHLPNVNALPLSDLETPELLNIRPTRTRAEYCWTLTPFAFDAVFDRESSATRVTYVDADVWLLRDPEPIFFDFDKSGAGVQITEHAYSPEYDQEATSGRYCVQFLTMERQRSDHVRERWQQQCIDWCFARAEDGRFGDQKYLDDWPIEFPSLVHVASPRSRFQGPWNATRFPYSEAITYHFHSLRVVKGDRVRKVSRGYSIPEPHEVHVYRPYLIDLLASARLVEAVHGSPVRQQGPRWLLWFARQKHRLAAIRRP
jgi:hypothetical protein